MQVRKPREPWMTWLERTAGRQPDSMRRQGDTIAGVRSCCVDDLRNDELLSVGDHRLDRHRGLVPENAHMRGGGRMIGYSRQIEEPLHSEAPPNHRNYQREHSPYLDDISSARSSTNVREQDEQYHRMRRIVAVDRDEHAEELASRATRRYSRTWETPNHFSRVECSALPHSVEHHSCSGEQLALPGQDRPWRSRMPTPYQSRSGNGHAPPGNAYWHCSHH